MTTDGGSHPPAGFAWISRSASRRWIRSVPAASSSRCSASRGAAVPAAGRMQYPPLVERLGKERAEVSSELVEKLHAIHVAPRRNLSLMPSVAQLPSPTALRSREAPVISTSTSSATPPMRTGCWPLCPTESGSPPRTSRRCGATGRRVSTGTACRSTNPPQQPPLARGPCPTRLCGCRWRDVSAGARLRPRWSFSKSFFDRTKDWADIEAVAMATPEDIDAARQMLADLLGEDDPAYQRLSSISVANPPDWGDRKRFVRSVFPARGRRAYSH